MADSWQTTSPQQTHVLGMVLGRSLVGGVTVALVGPLGAGKTQLVKGIAEGNGEASARKVTSPTFTLIHEYPGRLTLFHIDAYRLRGPRELLALGFDELVRADSAVVVEWADRVMDALPQDLLRVGLTPTGDTERRLEIVATGVAATRCFEAFQAACR